MNLPSANLDGKVAIVTGAARGLGKVESIALASAGASVTLMDKDLPACQQVAEEISGIGKPALAVKGDVRSSGDITRMVERTVAKFGKINILVNNAGVVVRKLATELSEDEWDEVIDVNLKGVFLCSQIVARQMIAQGQGGKIINIGGHLGFIVEPLRSSYSASKAGVTQLTKGLALELASYRINVNCIAPAVFKTGMPDQTRTMQPEFYKQLIDRIPLKRAGEPEEIIGVLLLLASDASNYITGQTIIVDGGITLR